MLKGMNAMTRFSHKVAVALLAALTLTPGAGVAETIRVGGVGGSEAIMRQLAAAFSAAHPGNSVEVMPRLGGRGSINALGAGAIDISVAGRPPTEQERAAAPMIVTAFLETPLLFVTSNRTATALTRQDVVDLYAARKQSWPDNTPIRPIVRDASESDVMILTDALPNYGVAMASARTRPELPSAPHDTANAELAVSIDGSFAAMTLLQVTAERLALQRLRLDGAEPTVENLAAERYPLRKRLHLLSRQDASPAVRRFLAFLATDDVRRTLLKAGAISLLR